ncbi:MAG: Flp family type IVb pilin [Pseudomonadota bacterium]
MPKSKSRSVSSFLSNESGATAVEYGLILALMTIALVGALATTGDSTKDKWDGVANKVGGAMDNAGS